MKKVSLLLTCLLISANIFAQDNMTYAEKAAELQKTVWGTDEPEFKTTAVPANLKNESAVVLARSFNSQTATTGKFKYLIITAAMVARTVKINTFHERVKVNDKVALDQYSQLEYQKKLDKTVSLLIAKFSDTHNTYIGAKIIKPDGKEIVVNTGEEVLTQNETKNQAGKLAISGLQVGDILDYYISNADVSEKGNTSIDETDKVIFLADEYPILYYNITFQINKKLHPKYISANNAPAFEVSQTDAGDQIFNIKAKNLAKYQSQLWISPYRQFPYIEFGASSSLGIFSGKKLEEMDMLSRGKTLFQNTFMEYQDFDVVEKKVKDYFKSGKNLKNAPLDSVMKVFYNQWKFNTFCTYTGKELDEVNSMNYRGANNHIGATLVSMMLTDMDIDHDILLVAPRTGNTLENVFNTRDFETVVRVNGETPMYMAFDDIVTHFNELPARLQGEKAIAIHSKRHNAMKYSFTDMADSELPVTTPDKNRVEEQLQVSLLTANMQKLKVDRVVKQTGSMRHDNQKLLLPVQDVDNGYMVLNNGETLEKRLSRVRETKKMAADYLFNFDKEHNEMSKNFTNEIKGNFDQEPEQLANFKIINPGLDNASPVFEYSASFILNNMVKKAGNNYIIDAGKLTGSFFKVEEKDKTRDKDIYMTSARSFKYTITLAIPQGYTVKGIEEFTRKKTNATGSFSSAATVSGNTLTITVDRAFNKNFEDVKNWTLLKDVLQAATDFNDQKILLEKKA
jgi:hypothetical protein